MRILMLTRYGRLGASSRVRTLQYLPYLNSAGWQVDVSPLFSDNYINLMYRGQPRWREVLLGYFRRVKSLARAGTYDLIWLEKEIFPFLPAGAERWLRVIGVPYVADYDDALFHRYDKNRRRVVRALLGRKIDSVMQQAAIVVTGNEYLSQRAKLAGAQRVVVVPTVVDLERYTVSEERSGRVPIIGWIGTPATSRYLLGLNEVFESVSQRTNARFVAVGGAEEGLRGTSIEAWNWTEETEVHSIHSFDIGIMPLPDEPWERGKCGYKLIQYMACARPVVASPVGANNQIVKTGINGFLAYTAEQWEKALTDLLSDGDRRRKMGLNGRETVKEWYSLQSQAPRLLSILQEAAVR